jgi:hypothetical protein
MLQQIVTKGKRQLLPFSANPLQGSCSPQLKVSSSDPALASHTCLCPQKPKIPVTKEVKSVDYFTMDLSCLNLFFHILIVANYACYKIDHLNYF